MSKALKVTIVSATVLAVFSVVVFSVEQGLVFYEFLFFYQKVGTDQKDLWEITYYITNSSLVFIAMVALTVAWIQSFHARRQADEAENTRLALAYMEISKLWKSPELIRSRSLIIEIADFYENRKTIPEFKTACSSKKIGNQADYLNFVLRKMRADARGSVRDHLIIATFLEDLGVLCRNSLIKKEHVLEFIGSGIKYATELLLPYMTQARLQNDRSESTYANAFWLYRAAVAHKNYTEPHLNSSKLFVK